MSHRAEIYVCELCGHIVEILGDAEGTLVCCGQDMTLLQENTTDASKEKHVPLVTVSGTTAVVQVGSVAHPMEPQHSIAWIELQQGNKIQRAYTKPGEPPQAAFAVEAGLPVAARAYCNMHGLWKTN